MHTSEKIWVLIQRAHAFMGGAALLKSPQSKTSPRSPMLGRSGVHSLRAIILSYLDDSSPVSPSRNIQSGSRTSGAYSRRHRRTAHALEAGVVGHPDSHRPHFYELDGSEHVYYIFPYPAGQKVLLIAVWQESGRRCKFFGPPISPVASKASKRSVSPPWCQDFSREA